jgi:gas vesicle protein
MGNTNKVLTALGIGLAAGAVLGVLFAPRKGAETRDMMSKKSKAFADEINDGIAEGRKKLNALKDGLRESKNHFEKKLDEVL